MGDTEGERMGDSKEILKEEKGHILGHQNTLTQQHVSQLSVNKSRTYVLNIYILKMTPGSPNGWGGKLLNSRFFN